MSWDTDGWSREKKAAKQDARQGDAPAEKPAGTDESAWREAGRVAAKKKRRKFIVIGAASLLVVVVLLVALAPKIASGFAPGIVEGAANDAVPGRVEVDSASLSWFGSQRLRGVELFDPASSRVARAEVEVERGLFGLLFGGLDLGTVHLRGEADVVRDAEGVTNLERALGVGAAAPPGSGSASTGEPAVPSGLNAELDLADFTVTYEDPALAELTGGSVQVVRVADLRGLARVGAGSPTELRLAGKVTTGRTRDAIDTPAGSIDLNASARGLIESGGRINTTDATVDASLEVDAVATALVDALAQQEGRLVAALGEDSTATLEIDGTLREATVTLTARSGTLEAIANLVYDGAAQRVRSGGPITVAGDTARLISLAPDAETALKSSAGLDITQWPRATLSVENLQFALPKEGRLDLRGSGALVKVALGEAAATVPVPAVPTASGNQNTADRWRVAIDPAELEIAARDLAGEITVRTETAVRVDRDPAGRVAVNLSVADLLDASGQPRTDRAPRVRGSVSATGVALGIVEPLLAETGLRLTQDIGPTLDVALRAEPRTDGSQGVSLTMTAAKLRAEGTLIADDRTVTLADSGLTVRLTDTGPLVRRLSGPADINIDSGGDVTLAVTRFQAPYTALVEGDLRTLALDASVELSETVGRARTLASDQITAGDRRRVALRGVKLGVRSDGLGSGARVSVDGTARVDNRPAGTLDGDLYLAGFVTPEGSIVAGVPSAMSGEIALRGVSADVLQPLVTDAGIDLTRDVGETIDLRVNASSLASAGGNNADAPTRVTLTLDASRLDATGEFEIAGTTLSTRGSGVRVEHDAPVATGARLAGLLAGPDAIRVENGGRLVATLTDLSLPIDPATRGIDPDAARGSFRAELTGARVLRTADAPGAGADLSIGSFVVDGSLTPGQGMKATIAGDMTGAGQPFRIEGNASSPTVGGDLTQTTSVSVLVERMPTALASLLPTPPTVGTVPLNVLLQDVVGPWASVRLGSSPAGGAARAVVSQVVSDGAEITLNATADGLLDAGTPMSLSALDARGTIRLRPAGLARSLAAAGVSGENGSPSPVTLDRTAEIALTAGLNTRGDAVDLRLRADRVGLNGLQQALGLAGDPGTVGVGFDAGASVPTAALLGGDANAQHTLTATVRGDVRDDRGSRVASVDLESSVATKGLTPDGPARATGSVSGVRSAWLDRLMTAPGQETPGSPLVAGALGQDLSVAFESDATLAQGELSRASVTLTPQSETISVKQPVRLALAGDTVTLPEAFELTWQMPAAWATAHLGGTLTTAGDRPGAASTTRPIVSFMNPVTWAVRADTLRYPLDRTRAGAASPDVALSIVGTAMRVTLIDGSERVYPRTTVTARTIDADATVALTAEVDAGSAGGGGRAVSFNGRLYGLDPVAAARGVEPAITGQGELRDLPSGLFDALADTGGSITMLAGNTVRATVELQDFPRLGGTIGLRSDFPNGSARYEGEVTNPTGVEKLLVLRSPAEVRLDRIQEQSSRAVTTFLPAFGQVSKDPARHAPARLDVRRLSLPFSGEITAVEAEARIDPGEVGFKIAGGLGQLLALTGQATEGTALQRFEAVSVRMNNGIATYENFKLPIGEFRFESSGRFDLVANTEEITLWAPLAALATEGLSIPGLGGKSIINPDALVPINRAGPMAADNPWKLDLAGARGQLIRPGEAIKDALEGAIPKP